jgi:hypothetical protein
MSIGKNSRQPLFLEGETWKAIVGFEQYSVSNFGRIRTEPRQRKCGVIFNAKIMSPNKGNNICLRKDKKNYWFKLPQLILMAFIGPPIPGKGLARHLDDNPQNNHLSNLAWGNYVDNMYDAIRNGKRGAAGTEQAKNNAIKLKGIPRPESVRLKISLTKQLYPERQFFGDKRDQKTGRFSK